MDRAIRRAQAKPWTYCSPKLNHLKKPLPDECHFAEVDADAGLLTGFGAGPSGLGEFDGLGLELVGIALPGLRIDEHESRIGEIKESSSHENPWSQPC